MIEFRVHGDVGALAKVAFKPGRRHSFITGCVESRATWMGELTAREREPTTLTIFGSRASFLPSVLL
jgi:hypothetical protein